VKSGAGWPTSAVLAIAPAANPAKNPASKRERIGCFIENGFVF
jgi:hypothetical protein